MRGLQCGGLGGVEFHGVLWVGSHKGASLRITREYESSLRGLVYVIYISKGGVSKRLVHGRAHSADTQKTPKSEVDRLVIFAKAVSEGY